jgi:LPS-assembly protein
MAAPAASLLRGAPTGGLLAARALFLLPPNVRRFSPLHFSLLFVVAALRAAEPSASNAQLSGARATANVNEAVYYGDAAQRARLADGDVLLLADEIHFVRATNVAVATGNVVLTRGALRLLADKITYNSATRAYAVASPRFTFESFNVLGSSLEGAPDKLSVKDAQLAYTEPGPWAPTIRSSSLDFNLQNQTIHAELPKFGLGGLGLFSLPFHNLSVNDPLLGALSVRAGYRASLGAFLDAGLLAPVGPGVQLGGDLGYYTQRGVLFGPAAEVSLSRPGFTFKDTLRTGFIHDNGDRKTDILARPVPANRSFIEWQHHEEIGDDVMLFGQLSRWSDSDVLRDFRPEQFYPVQEPDTFIEADYAGANSVTSLFVRAQPNAFFPVQERLPEMRYDQLPTPLGLGVYDRFSASAALLQEAALPPGSGPTVTSKRVDSFYELTRPFTPREWLSIKPVAGARLTYYADATGGRSTYTRALGEIGADAELHASATYDYANARQGIDGLRHLLTPTLSYRYIPAAASGTPFIPAIDRNAFSTYLQPLGLAGTRNIDQLAATNTVRFGLNNTLQTRDPHYGSRDLATLNFAVDWRLSRAVGQRPFSAVQTEMAVMPASWLRVDTFSRVDPRNGALRELNTGVTLHDGDAWSARLGSHYLQHQLQEYVLDAGYRLDEAHELVTRLHYDERLARFVEQDYGLRQNLGNLWLVRYLIVLYQGPRRESAFGFNVEVELRRW